MQFSKQVKCIKQLPGKEEHERITHIGGDWGIITEAEAIYNIQNDIQQYHVRTGSQDALIVVIEHLGKKYLRTAPDHTKENNLLNLGTCV